MIFKIESERVNLISTETLDWSEKLDFLKSVESFETLDELLDHFQVELGLCDEQLHSIKNCFSNSEKCVRYIGTNMTFKIEPVSLNLKSFDGKLIYWQDWDFIFYRNSSDFCLWVYIGGMSDMWHKIKLSKSQVEKYKSIGMSEIDYLTRDLRNWKTSIEFEKAEKENRIIL